jgi:hypothetical protein
VHECRQCVLPQRWSAAYVAAIWQQRQHPSAGMAPSRREPAVAIAGLDGGAPERRDVLVRPPRASPPPTFAERGAGVLQELLLVRGARGSDVGLLVGEPAGAGRVRVRVQGRARRQREGGGGEAAQVRQRAGGARVPGGGGDHQPRAPPPPGVARGLLHRGQPAHARLRVRGQQHAGAPFVRQGRPCHGLEHPHEDRARLRQGPRLPPRGLPSSDHPPRHQGRQHPAGQQLRGHGGGLRAGQAHDGHKHARVHARDGHLRLPGAGVRVQRQAHGQVGRLLLRRHAAGAAHGAPPHRYHQLHGGQPRGLGAPAAERRAGGGDGLRRARRPPSGRRVLRRRGGALGGLRRRQHPPLGQAPPQDEPDRARAGGRRIAGGSAPGRRQARAERALLRRWLRQHLPPKAARLRQRRLLGLQHRLLHRWWWPTAAQAMMIYQLDNLLLAQIEATVYTHMQIRLSEGDRERALN